VIHLDSHPLGSNVSTIVDIVGVETGVVKATVVIGPSDPGEHQTFEESVPLDFENLDEPHVINVKSSDESVPLSFTLTAHVLTPLAAYSELVAALLMVAVYILIPIEVIHQTLVAVIGSMVVLMLYYIMTGGRTVAVENVMLHMEWSTLGLLFGMMLLVGELSHTGIFEWCAVRLLVASKGSFVRLMVLLASLTAVASAFLDNVTTMLLIAPVTIDMCSILGVDPRPYLIAEVLMSNIGGTATMIGTNASCYDAIAVGVSTG
jgi:di/tricarboxylate transporter